MKMKILRDESGQVLVLTVLCASCFMGFVALAIDVGLFLHAKRVVQTAADSGAIAGAAELNFGDMTTAAQADAAQNGVTDGVGGATVTVNNPPTSGPHLGSNGYVEVIVSQPQPTFFLNLFNRSSMMVTARAVATTVPSPSCVDTLQTNPTTPTGSHGAPVSVPGIDMSSGSPVLTLSSCGILDNAEGTAGSLTMGGGTTISAASIGVLGTTSIHNGASLTPPTPTTLTAPISDPLSSIVSAPLASSYSGSCQADPALSKSIPYTIGPSTSTGFVCYNGLTISHSPTVTLNPGLYIINGPGTLDVSGGAVVNGTGVTFYFVNGAGFNITNGAALTLSAPTNGAYSGLLFYQDPNDTASDAFVGGSSGSLNGIFYLPNANLTFANGNSSTFSTDLVVGSLVMTGNAKIKPYAPLAGGSPLSSPRLVE
jgi:Flp pilus assembly protein TadG